MAFKVGQKVVYVGTENNLEFNVPQHHEIITIESIDKESTGTYYSASEYLYTKEGEKQHFYKHELKPLDHSFADSVLEKVKRDNLVNN